MKSVSRLKQLLFLVIGILWVSCCAQATSFEEIESSAPTKEITLEEAINTALRQNPDILRTKQELQRLEGVTVEVRAQALPKVSLHGEIGTQAKDLATGGLPFGQNESYWTSGVRIKQLLSVFGAVNAAIDAGKLAQKKSFQNVQTAVDQTVYNIRTAFYNVLLNRSLIEVQQESVHLLEEELANERHRLKAGAVTRFNTLRAEVELANAQPPLIRAKNDYRLAIVNLTRLMGVNLNTSSQSPFDPVGELEFTPVDYNLDQVLSVAMANRPELKASALQVEIEKKNIVVSRADYYPSFSAVGGYDFRSNRFKEDLSSKLDGWSIGIQGNWNLFDGYLTKGKVQQAEASLASAVVTAEEMRRNVDVEVRQAFSKLEEATELITSQKKNVEQAEESLRLASARLNAGAGTQIDVLSAQVALTQARANELHARYDYNIALAQLDRATSVPVRK